MSGDKKYYWLKLKRDFFKRHDIRIIESAPNGKDYILFYLKLLCESVDHNGNLRFSEQIPYNEEMLSVITNTNIDIVRNAINMFASLGMMEVLDDGTYFMNEVERMIGSETKWAAQKRNQRELPKMNNGSVRLNGELLRLPDGTTKYVDEKLYGGNGMLVLDRAGGKCEICGSTDDVSIYHNNGDSNDPTDLVCVCRTCCDKLNSGDIRWTFSTPSPPYVHQDIEKDIEKDIDNIPYREIVDYLNKKTGKRFSYKTASHKKYIKARWNEGYRTEQFFKVIDNMSAGWKGTKYEKYLQPSTLFAPKHFDEYLNQEPKRWIDSETNALGGDMDYENSFDFMEFMEEGK